MTICARCARCFWRRGRFSGRSIGRGRSASSICGSRRWRSRSVTARPGAAMSSLRAWAIRAFGAGALVFSKEAPDLLWGIARCLWSLGALPRAGLGPGGRAARGWRPPNRRYAACLRPVESRLVFLRGARSAGQGRVEKLQQVPGDQLRAGPRVRQPRSTSSAAGRLVREGQRARIAPALPAGRPPRRGASR